MTSSYLNIKSGTLLAFFSVLQLSPQLENISNANQKPGPKKRSLAIHRNEKPQKDVVIAPRPSSGKAISQARETTLISRIDELPKMTTNHRGSIVFLGDASPSMGRSLSNGKFQGTLAEFVKDALGETLAEVVEASKENNGNLKHNADISVFSYYDSVDNNGDSSTLVDSVLPACLLYTSPSPRDATLSRMPSSA